MRVESSRNGTKISSSKPKPQAAGDCSSSSDNTRYWLPPIIFFRGKTYCYANFFCYANFSIVLDQNFKGEGKPSVKNASRKSSILLPFGTVILGYFGSHLKDKEQNRWRNFFSSSRNFVDVFEISGTDVRIQNFNDQD